MKVPLQLHRTAERAPATALLLPSGSVADLLRLCAALKQESGDSGDNLPSIFRAADGFLIVLARPTSRVYPGVIHLRSRIANLLLPWDAELVPALLDDEAAGLVRQRGLVFLPGGRVLAFFPDRPLSAADLLHAPPLSRPSWQCLPEPPPLADRLHEVRLILPDTPAEEVLRPGGKGIGEEMPRPDKAGVAATLAGAGMVGAGKGLAWLAGLMHWKALANWGAALARAGMRRAPRLMESVLGRQEAALRELLRQFRAGNLEEALRRALPLGGGNERGGSPARNADLPRHDLRYSLSNLLQGGGGPFAWWRSSAEVQVELIQEYRKAALAALERGDYRRAAFIYGRLLSDFRQAAAVLARAGLHHDAALLYLEKVGDRRAAAQQFEAAGDLDRALELYRALGEHIEAGNLLRRAGDEEAALQEYLAAVKRLAAHDFAGRGDVLHQHARRPDLALEYYQRGWDQRPALNSFPCLMRLLSWHGEQGIAPPLLELVSQAEEVFARSGNETAAGAFYNQVAQLADKPTLAEVRDELRDRALCGLADKLRQRAAGGSIENAVSLLLGRSGTWQAAVVHDAQIAMQAAASHAPPAAASSAVSLVRVATGPVTAVCHAWASGLVFLGTASGSVCCFDPRTSRTTAIPPVWGTPYPITALSCSDDGSFLVVLINYPPAIRRLVSYRKDGERYAILKEHLHTPTSPDCWLTNCTGQAGHEVVGCWDGSQLQMLSVADLVTTGQVPLPGLCWETNDGLTQFELVIGASGPPASSAVTAAILVRLGTGSKLDTCLLCWRDYLLVSRNLPGLGCMRVTLGRPVQWRAGLPPLEARFMTPAQLHLVFIDDKECIHKIRLNWASRQEWGLAHHQKSAAGYTAAAWLRPDHVIGVRPDGIHWLRTQGEQLLPAASFPYPIEDAIACCVVPGSSEVLVLCKSGWLLRAHRPR